jgi:hypothetical protein
MTLVVLGAVAFLGGEWVFGVLCVCDIVGAVASVALELRAVSEKRKKK